MYGIYAQKILVITLHGSRFCKMWSHTKICFIGINFSFFLKYKITKLWLQGISGFVFGPYQVSATLNCQVIPVRAGCSSCQGK